MLLRTTSFENVKKLEKEKEGFFEAGHTMKEIKRKGIPFFNLGTKQNDWQNNL